MQDELEPSVNTGLLTQPPAETDWQAGGETGIGYKETLPTGDWTPFLPSGESQVGVYFDTMACVTFSALNCVETQIKALLATGSLRPETVQAIADLGFIQNGEFNASDRFTAKMSGTTRQGNYLTKVWDSIRKDGLVPEADWNYPRNQRQPVFDWDDFYADIPQSVRDKARKFLELFDVSYEWVAWQNPSLDFLKQQLKQAPLQVGTPTCPPWNTSEVIPWCNYGQANHATMIYKIGDAIEDLDHYNPYKKHLALNFPIFYVMKGIVTEKPKAAPAPTPAPAPAPRFRHTFSKDMLFGERSNEVKALQDALKADGVMDARVQSTGYYGAITQAAVRAFQVKHQVASVQELAAVNGKRVGSKTRDMLNRLFA